MSDAIKGIEDVISGVVRRRERARRPHKPLKESARIAGDSIHKNFEVGGRPRWKPHAESTRRKTYGPSRLLVRKGELEGSFRPFVTRASAGQRSKGVVYGPRQNFGYKGGQGRGHSPTPARTFAIFQPEDATTIGGVFLSHVTE